MISSNIYKLGWRSKEIDVWMDTHTLMSMIIARRARHWGFFRREEACMCILNQRRSLLLLPVHHHSSSVNKINGSDSTGGRMQVHAVPASRGIWNKTKCSCALFGERSRGGIAGCLAALVTKAKRSISWRVPRRCIIYEIC
jgi:hypothetical protein